MDDDDDISILKGLSYIVNRHNTKSGINIDEIEKTMVSEPLVEEQVKNDTKYKNELESYAKKLGLDLSDTDQSNVQNTSKSAQLIDKNTYNSNYTNNNDKELKHLSKDILDKYDDSSDGDDDKDTDDDDKEKKYSATSWIDDMHFKPKTELETRTDEEKKHSQIQSVIKDMGGSNSTVWSIEKEKEEDNKATMLEEIDSLKLTLEEDGINIERIPNVSQKNTYEEISAVHKIFRLKNDRSRYCSFAEEFLLFGAHGVEELFNGENVWLGRYSPDLTGWHNHVQVKLRRMRHDTSTLVSGIMQGYNIGPGLRIMLELIPSMFMYSKMRKTQFGSKKLYSEESMGYSMKRIRDVDEGFE